MKKITFIFLFLCSISFGQNLGNPAIIGQTNRNQKVGKGLQVTDTLITDGVVILKNLATFGSGVDTGVGFKNGKIVRFLNTGGGSGTVTSVSVITTNGISGTVANSTTTPAITLQVDTISKFATRKQLLDSIDRINTAINTKQETLISGTNIKTVNSNSILGSGNIIVSGGSPAGSGTQIQINQSGAFFADSTFQKSDTDFNVGLDHTQQSTVSFTGSGLDDLTVGGTFIGTVPTTYTVTIDGVNQEFLPVETSTISGGTFAVSDTVTNGTGGSADIVSISVIGDRTYLRVTINSGSFASGDVVDNGSGVTGTLNDNQTTYDIVTYTDGVVTETNIPTFTEPTYFVNGILFVFGATTGHTLTDEWTWDYTLVNQNVLDFSNNDYKFQSTFGDGTFGYQISDNLLGFGLKGALNTYTNTGGDFGILGFTSSNGTLGSTNQLYFSGGERASTYLAKNQYDIEVGNGTDKFLQSITPVTFSYINIIGGINYGIEQSAGAVTIGNISGGNNTKITIDDVTQLVTISNVPTYADDAAAAIGGLTSGMLYKTTTGGITALNIVP